MPTSEKLKTVGRGVRYQHNILNIFYNITNHSGSSGQGGSRRASEAVGEGSLPEHRTPSCPPCKNQIGSQRSHCEIGCCCEKVISAPDVWSCGLSKIIGKTLYSSSSGLIPSRVSKRKFSANRLISTRCNLSFAQKDEIKSQQKLFSRRLNSSNFSWWPCQGRLPFGTINGRLSSCIFTNLDGIDCPMLW